MYRASSAFGEGGLSCGCGCFGPGFLSCLGDVHLSSGDLSSARRAWASALRIFDDLDHPDAALIRAKLNAEFLGHARINSSRRYFALASEQIRQCCLPLAEF